MTTPAKTLFSNLNNTDAGYSIAFWFAVLSPALGVLLGLLALLLLVH
ncbi:MAG TPA: hypothetical protein VMO75_02440 [Chthoniobacterales bacterium]|nr:hypothetical protein [Chthoniobacterales bacterium]